MKINAGDLPKETILGQMAERRPLPIGVSEFHEWSDRIISGALLPGGTDDPKVFIESQKFALAGMLMHLGPTESYKEDAYFIHSLRKVAVNQIAHAISKELHEAAKARTAAEDAAKAASEEAKPG